MNHMILKRKVKLVDQVHLALEEKVHAGDTVLDATVGNGKDTIKLADLVGDKGRVYGFDIQNLAIEQTRLILEKNNLLHRVKLFRSCHSIFDFHLSESIRGNLKAVVFNLGFLPGSDKDIITQKKSTLKALNLSYQWLMQSGVLSILCYRGHHGGNEETDAIREMIENEKWSSREFEGVKSKNSPLLFIIVKH